MHGYNPEVWCTTVFDSNWLKVTVNCRLIKSIKTSRRCDIFNLEYWSCYGHVVIQSWENMIKCFNLHGNCSVDGAPRGLHSRDPRWIGAWWLGYLFFAIGLSLVAIPMMFFPRILPMGRDQKANRVLSKSVTGKGASKVWNVSIFTCNLINSLFNI